MASNPRMNSHPMLMSEYFVAYYPSLGRALGSIEDAVIVQHLWFCKNPETCETVATADDIAEAIGMSVTREEAPGEAQEQGHPPADDSRRTTRLPCGRSTPRTCQRRPFAQANHVMTNLVITRIPVMTRSGIT